MFGHRIIVPQSLRHEFLNKLHEGHPGITAMKNNARFYVWWPGLLQDVENFVKTCKSCQKFRPQDPESPLYCWDIPDSQWERLHIDFLAPLDDNYWLVIIDAFSMWMEIEPINSPNSANVIRILDSCFAHYVVPKTIVSDNGTCFTSEDYRLFCIKLKIKAIHTTPYHIRSNGAAERVIRTFKSRYSAERNTCEDKWACLNRVRFCLRNSIHVSTNRTPSELFLGRKLNKMISNLQPCSKRSIHYAKSLKN
ncbi:Pro-Pol polyprotein [Thelohanellus kitauei]|uniref:Pro-Pol polyprotein n=1 Tax=Thelohanellus kitauei TaxID=669202 RepID=A0A0C2J370_THEKT|nr:Pro-Pol polyprotein [Thelohanellus kitauei]